MSDLKSLQGRFVEAILADPGADFTADVVGGGRLSAAEAVEVYRRGYAARLMEALGETFEASWRVLGDEVFFRACREFIERTPSRSHNLSDYGAGFPDFLDARPESARAPFLGDLARFEWAFKELFHARRHEGLAPAALAAAGRPDSILRFGGATALLSLRHRVHAIWKRDRDDDTPLKRSDWQGGQRLILYKKDGHAIFVRELSAPEYAALTALAGGRTLEAALDGAEGLDDDGARELFAFVAESRIVTSVERPGHLHK